MPNAVIIDAVRTPIGRIGGALAGVRPDDLAAHVIRAIVERTGIDPERIDDVILGCANQAGEDNRNVARMALLLAGLPVTVSGVTVNRLCASGLQAVTDAARAIRAGEGFLFIAGGVESMTRAPMVMPKSEQPYARGNQTLYDTTLGWRMINPRMEELYPVVSLGETAENVAARHGVSRQEQDEFSLASQRNAAAAWENGRYDAEVVPINAPQGKKGAVTVSRDEHPRPETTLAGLAALKPAFRAGGTVTAGNSSGLNDGAAALLIAEEGTARQLGLTPLARILGAASAGVDPAYMGIGPVPATRKLLQRLDMRTSQFDLVELNEAFAAQAVACARELDLPFERVNVNGGAIALGHPLGCSGARLATTLVHELTRRGGRFGLATMCIGVGQGLSLAIERWDG